MYRYVRCSSHYDTSLCTCASTTHVCVSAQVRHKFVCVRVCVSVYTSMVPLSSQVAYEFHLSAAWGTMWRISPNGLVCNCSVNTCLSRLGRAQGKGPSLHALKSLIEQPIAIYLLTRAGKEGLGSSQANGKLTPSLSLSLSLSLSFSFSPPLSLSLSFSAFLSLVPQPHPAVAGLT